VATTGLVLVVSEHPWADGHDSGGLTDRGCRGQV
jgi:hypothetical protein